MQNALLIKKKLCEIVPCDKEMNQRIAIIVNSTTWLKYQENARHRLFLNPHFIIWLTFLQFKTRFLVRWFQIKIDLNTHNQKPHLRIVLFLTQWGRETHICISKQTNIGSENGLAPANTCAIPMSTSDGKHTNTFLCFQKQLNRPRVYI